MNRIYIGMALSFLVGTMIFGLVMAYVGGGDCSKVLGRTDPSQSVFTDCRE